MEVEVEVVWKIEQVVVGVWQARVEVACGTDADGVVADMIDIAVTLTADLWMRAVVRRTGTSLGKLE